MSDTEAKTAFYNTVDYKELRTVGFQRTNMGKGYFQRRLSEYGCRRSAVFLKETLPTLKTLGSDKQPLLASETIDFSKVKIEPLFEDEVDFDTFSKSDFRAVKIKDCKEVPKSKKLLQFTLDDGTGEERTILSGIKEYYDPEDLIGRTAIAITNLPPRKMMGIESCGMLISAVHKEEDEEKLNLLIVDDHIPAGAKLY